MRPEWNTNGCLRNPEDPEEFPQSISWAWDGYTDYPPAELSLEWQSLARRCIPPHQAGSWVGHFYPSHTAPAQNPHYRGWTCGSCKAHLELQCCHILHHLHNVVNVSWQRRYWQVNIAGGFMHDQNGKQQWCVECMSGILNV